MTTWAVLPVRSFPNAKHRLARALPREARASLARNLFDHVLKTTLGCIPARRILVLTDSPEVARLAERRGARAQFDRSHAQLNPLGNAVNAGLAELGAGGAARALVLMSDLPLLEAADLERLMTALDTHDMAVAPDRRREGTNALALDLEKLRTASFGYADSFTRHHQLARQHELSVAEVTTSGLGLDLDWPEDLLTYALRIPATLARRRARARLENAGATRH